jgi:hypothetical protein
MPIIGSSFIKVHKKARGLNLAGECHARDGEVPASHASACQLGFYIFNARLSAQSINGFGKQATKHMSKILSNLEVSDRSSTPHPQLRIRTCCR